MKLSREIFDSVGKTYPLVFEVTYESALHNNMVPHRGIFPHMSLSLAFARKRVLDSDFIQHRDGFSQRIRCRFARKGPRQIKIHRVNLIPGFSSRHLFHHGKMSRSTYPPRESKNIRLRMPHTEYSPARPPIRSP